MKNRISNNHWLINRAAAHRGFHGNGIPENSRGAFLKAIELDYPIETDVQLTKDLVPVCFHDDTLERMTGVKSYIWDLTYEELKKLTLANTQEKIMTLYEFLSLVNERVPLLIEIKNQRENKIAVEKTLNALKTYKGEFVIQSFDPRIMGMVRKQNPEIIRGQLITKWRSPSISYLTYKLLAHGLLNFISRPDFVNVDQNDLPVSKRMSRGKKVLCWTIRSEEEEKKVLPYVSSYVFENITPKRK